MAKAPLNTAARLVLHAGEHWPQGNAAVRWQTLDAHERILAQGESAPAHWPGARETVVVLSGSQSLALQLKLPPGQRREEEKLLRYALEEHIIGDIDEQHITPIHRQNIDGGTLVDVLVTHRPRLQQIVAQLTALGRAPARVVSELQLAAAPRAGVATLTEAGEGWLLALPERPAQFIDAASLTDNLPALLPAEGIEKLIVYPRNPRSRLALDLPVACEVAARLHRLDDPERILAATNLLHGSLRPQNQPTPLTALRLPLAIAAGAAAIGLLALLADTLWQRSQLSALNSRMEHLLTSALPNTPPINPSAQLTQALDAARSAHGLLRSDDFLPLLAAYADANGGAATRSLQSLEYNNGRLTLTLHPEVDDPLQFQQRLRTHGYHIEAQTPATFTLATQP